mgnify:CR=1 FL=1
MASDILSLIEKLKRLGVDYDEVVAEILGIDFNDAKHLLSSSDPVRLFHLKKDLVASYGYRRTNEV